MRLAVLVGLAGLVPFGALAQEDKPERDSAAVEASAPAPDAASSAAEDKAAPAMPEPAATAARPDLAPFRDAVLAYRRGDVTGGDRLRPRGVDPIATTLLDWAAIRFGGALVDFERVAAFARANPDWPGLGWVRKRAEEAALAERKPAALLRPFFARERPVTASGKLALALSFKADNLNADAAALIRDAWRNDSFGRETESRILDEFSETLTQGDHRFRMERLLFKENWEGAKRAAEHAGKDYAALVKARNAVASKSSQAAKLLDAVPASLRADSSYLFSRAQFLRRAGKAVEAAKLIADVPRDPAILADGDEWWVERRLIARKLLDDGDPKAAYAVASAHGATGSERRIEAEFHCGWIALRFLDAPETAARHFARAAGIAATPISLARVAYWQGRAAEASGTAEEAQNFYRRAAAQGITYYGQLAAAKLGRSQSPLRPSIHPASPERIAAAKSPVVQAVALLYAAGLRDMAYPLVIEIGKQGQNAAELDAVGDVVEENRDARALLALGKGATQRGLPLDEQAFPTIGIPNFEPLGSNVEKAMIYAITRQESAFDPAAGSSVGARGLMQLMPATAQGLAKKFGVEYDPSRLVDPTYNARLGAAFLGDLMETWKGSHILTFASYNAGPGNAKKWIDAYGDPRSPQVDPIDWVERIPFSETRNYVQRVIENLAVYRKRLDERSALLTDPERRDGVLR